MNYSRRLLESGGIICFLLALFQAVIGFSPSLSVYFGAPESLVQNIYALLSASLFIAGLLVLFGFYAFSGAGRIQKLPFLKQALIVIGVVFILRGLFIIPNILVIMGKIETSIQVPARFVFFSIGSLLVGILFTIGVAGSWKTLQRTDRNHIKE